MSLPAQVKLEAVLAILKDGKTISSVAREYKVARKTLYIWVARYKDTNFKRKVKALENQYVSGSSHPRAISPRVEFILKKLVVTHPAWGCRKYSLELKKRGYDLGYFGVNSLLKRLGAETPEFRENFRRSYSGPGRLNTTVKLEIVKECLEGESVSNLSKRYQIARKTIYKWITNYHLASTKGIVGALALSESYAKGEAHPRAVYPKITQKLLSLVAENPALSVHKLTKYVPASSWTVWKILDRNNLNSIAARLAYAESLRGREVAFPARILDRIKLVWEEFIPSLAPAPPPTGPGALRAGDRFSKIFKIFSTSAILTFLILSGLFYWIRLLGGTTSFGSGVGIIMATVALGMGSIFFLYSLKYYITLAIVLSFSQQEATSNQQSATSKEKGFLSWLLGLAKGNAGGNGNGPKGYSPIGLEPNLEHVILKRHPFISVHIPLFNEKNVVERVIAASTNFQYPGSYEVILCDDSTDETSKIISDYLGKLQTPNSKLKTSKGDGYTLTQAEVKAGVTLKHLKRTSRSGFKGGALKLALTLTDPKAEFVSVFDADFVPYPDTLELFLKYFQVTAGTLDFKKVNSGKWMVDSENSPNTMHQTPTTSNIAAIQGYQWHVLNKSENWITRGVRSEYSGSYVIERSGTEIYSGLKQISGSVYMIRKDVLAEIGWDTSITEDFQLTLKLYEAGYKVVYTPYIQAPAECVSTIKRLIRQRMRWAEGHSNNIRRMFVRLMFGRWEEDTMLEGREWKVDLENRVLKVDNQSSTLNPQHPPPTFNHLPSKRFIPSPLTLSEKLEFLYLSPYYLQAFFFLIGTLSWLISETIFTARLPFWTSIWGWSLVLTNMLSLPLMNAVGLFLEESEEKDYVGLTAFVALSYILVPFQAYAALKGFLEHEEGPWFRTPKTGRITDIFARGRFYRFISGILPGRAQLAVSHSRISNSQLSIFNKNSNHQSPITNHYLSLATANSRFDRFEIRVKRKNGWLGRSVVALVLVIFLTLLNFASLVGSSNNVRAFEKPQLVTIADAQRGSSSAPSLNTNNSDTVSAEEIRSPRMISKPIGDGELMAIVFYQRPKVEISIGGYSMTFETTSIGGNSVNPRHSTIVADSEVTYEDITDGVDLRYLVGRTGISEEFILKERTSVEPFLKDVIEQSIKLDGLEAVSSEEESIRFVSSNDEAKELMRFDSPFAKDANGAETQSIRLAYREAKSGGFLSKVLDPSAIQWLLDPERSFPVSIDPSVILSGGFTEAEAQRGGQQRKVVYVNANWYAFYADASTLFYQKSSDGSSWGSQVTVSSANVPFAPTAWVEGTTIYVAWFSDTGDAFSVNTIDTASSDALGTQCNTGDIGYVSVNNPQDFPTLAVADNGTVYVATGAQGSNSHRVYKLTYSGCTFTDITLGSGLTDQDNPTITTIGNNLHMVYQDGNGLAHTVYNGTNWIDYSYTRTEANASQGGQQRKIVYVNGNWYAFATTNESLHYRKSSNGSSWGDVVILESTTDNPIHPTAWVEGTTIYVAWAHITGDRISVNTIDTSSSDALGTQCSSNDLGDFQTPPYDYPALAVADNGTVYTAWGGTNVVVLKLTYSGCSFSDITSGSGLTTQDYPTLTTIGNNLHMVFQDGSGLAHAVYDGSDWIDLTQTMTEIRSRQGGQQRKIVYVNGNWYAFAYTNDSVFYRKSSDGSSWGGKVTVSSANEPFAPTAWAEGTTIYVAWFRDNGDAFAVNTIDTASSDALGTQCNTGDIGYVAATNAQDFPTIAVADDGTVYTVTGAQGSNSHKVYKLTYSGCSFSDITSGSGLTDQDNPTITTIGNNLHMVFQDGNLSHSVYDGSSWTTSNTTIDSDTDSVFSLVSDGANLWLLTVDDSSSAAFYECASCPTTSPSWSGMTSPWTSQTNLTSVSLTYDSSNTDLYAMVIKGSSEQAYYKSTDVSSISWSGEISFGFTAGDLGHISSPEVGAGTSQVAVVVREGGKFRFANLTPSRSTIVGDIQSGSDTSFSLLSDGTNLWLLSVYTSSATGFYKCASCSSGSSWSSQTSPWTSQTNVTSVSLTYDSSNTDLYAMVIKNASEQAYYKSTDVSSISWSGETSFGFTAGDLGHISSPEVGAGTSQIGVVVREGGKFRFSNLTPSQSTIIGDIEADTNDTVFSLTTDGTNLWLLTVDDSTSTAFYKCTSCSSSSTWSTETPPWTSQTNLTSVSLTYDSSNSDLYAMVIKDTSEQAYYKSTHTSSISWSGETSLGFTAGDLGHISSPEVGAGTSQIGVVLRQGANYEFAVVPENLFLLFVGGPFLPLFFKKSARRSYKWRKR